MTKQISITLDEEQLTYLDNLAEINSRSRSGMISYLIKQSMDQDKALDEEAKQYENNR
jgi:metal-responsive CopG/Arc/MetJ family transcriptional regulator